MSRPIVLSNGELHVGLNNYGLVHDLYFPYVGLENHAADNSLRHHIGVWVDGELSWLDDSTWTTEFSYPHNALIGHTVAKNDKFGITIQTVYNRIKDKKLETKKLMGNTLVKV